MTDLSLEPKRRRRPSASEQENRSSVPAAARGRSVDPAALSAEIVAKLTYAIGKDPIVARSHDWLNATILALRDRIIDRWMASTRAAYRSAEKRVYYLSLEFLIGRLLRDALNNLELTDAFRAALDRLGVEFDVIAELEPDAALGNGGLGRLAACFMESMATLSIPAYGYGIRYDHGLFRQKVMEGWQVELPEDWLDHGNPWEFERREATYEIGFGGGVEIRETAPGATRHVWKPAERYYAVAYDTPIVGWRGRRVNTLRLWSARAVDPIRLEAFNSGDHLGALSEQAKAESISQVLYPSDATPAGQELRLKQEYFFTSASLQDLLRRHVQQFGDIRTLPDKAAIQLNDTHPAIAIAELMRLLIDHYGIAWEDAWRITKASTAYTNHTLLPEALESWPMQLFERLLPRHIQIIYAINAKLIDEARVQHGTDFDMLAAISLIDEQGGKRIRMGQLAFAGSHRVNGVSALHTELMKQTVFRHLHRLYPDRIVNKTNGITPRRWLQQINPDLTALLRDVIGGAFEDDAAALKALVPHAGDSAFRDRFAAIKRRNKERLGELILQRVGVKVDPAAMFDVQIKRIHEYKRQLLNVLQTIAAYSAIKAEPGRNWVPRLKIFAGKAAPNYWQAKVIIKLVNDVAAVVNGDPAVSPFLNVVFLPNYNVSLAEVIVPAADLSEQISTAGMEASGTGNMKLALNGALTIGTLDGANIEIRQHVGEENIFIFGMTASEIEAWRRRTPDPAAEAGPVLKDVLALLRSGHFSPGDPGLYRPLVDGLLAHDWFAVTGDFTAYDATQRKVDALWLDEERWFAKAVLNTANAGWFSADRTIGEYARDIWGVPVD